MRSGRRLVVRSSMQCRININQQVTAGPQQGETEHPTNIQSVTKSANSTLGLKMQARFAAPDLCSARTLCNRLFDTPLRTLLGALPRNIKCFCYARQPTVI
jgi:hypothetical protein